MAVAVAGKYGATTTASATFTFFANMALVEQRFRDRSMYIHDHRNYRNLFGRQPVLLADEDVKKWLQISGIYRFY